MSSIWERLKRRIIGAHEIQLHGRTVNGVDQYRICLDSREQLRGSRKECDREWRDWARILNEIALEREEEAGA